MKVTDRQSQKTETANRIDQEFSGAAARLETRRAFHRLFVEITERPVGPMESSVSSRRIFEQLSDVHVQCSDPDCRNGGVFLIPIIREMLQNEETERLLMEMCPGRVPSRGNKAVSVRCQNMFSVKVILV